MKMQSRNLTKATKTSPLPQPPNTGAGKHWPAVNSGGRPPPPGEDFNSNYSVVSNSNNITISNTNIKGNNSSNSGNRTDALPPQSDEDIGDKSNSTEHSVVSGMNGLFTLQHTKHTSVILLLALTIIKCIISLLFILIQLLRANYNCCNSIVSGYNNNSLAVSDAVL